MSARNSGFTLVEVCLAITVMAVGVLSMCGLYSLGYRENRQSIEDVAAVSFADVYLAPLVQGLSATNMTWEAWCRIGSGVTHDMEAKGVADAVMPNQGGNVGWRCYVGVRNGGYYVDSGWRSLASSAFKSVTDNVPSEYQGEEPSVSGFAYGLVVTRRGAVIQLAFRASRREETLMTQPVIVAEVHFQGVANSQGGAK